MHIILGSENIENFVGKYTVLELDTLRMPNLENKTVTAYCVLEHIPLTELSIIDKKRELHENLLKFYKQKNWNYCLDAIDNLSGSWGGELDSFYHDLRQRIAKYIEQDPGDAWDGTIEKTVIGS